MKRILDNIPYAVLERVKTEEAPIAAAIFARYAHRSQVRKYTGEQYINHPKAVVELVRSVTSNPFIEAAAWLHDVLEDCYDNPLFGANELFTIFDPFVVQMVIQLTDVARPEDGNRAQRKGIEVVRLGLAGWEAQTIKLADIIHNTADILEHDPKFAETYMREKMRLLNVLTRGDRQLWLQAFERVDTFFTGKAMHPDDEDELMQLRQYAQSVGRSVR